MKSHFSRIMACPLFCLAMVLSSEPTYANVEAETCHASGWDMSKELDLFHGTPTAITGGDSTKSAAPIGTDSLFAVMLRSQPTVHFDNPPAKLPQDSDPHAATTRFVVSKTGLYRITINAPVWIDFMGSAGALRPERFTGWHECPVFRKSLEYRLDAGDSIVIQISNSVEASVRVAIVAL